MGNPKICEKQDSVSSMNDVPKLATIENEEGQLMNERMRSSFNLDFCLDDGRVGSDTFYEEAIGQNGVMLPLPSSPQLHRTQEAKECLLSSLSVPSKPQQICLHPYELVMNGDPMNSIYGRKDVALENKTQVDDIAFELQGEESISGDLDCMLSTSVMESYTFPTIELHRKHSNLSLLSVKDVTSSHGPSVVPPEALCSVYNRAQMSLSGPGMDFCQRSQWAPTSQFGESIANTSALSHGTAVAHPLCHSHVVSTSSFGINLDPMQTGTLGGICTRSANPGHHVCSAMESLNSLPSELYCVHSCSSMVSHNWNDGQEIRNQQWRLDHLQKSPKIRQVSWGDGDESKDPCSIAQRTNHASWRHWQFMTNNEKKKQQAKRKSSSLVALEPTPINFALPVVKTGSLDNVNDSKKVSQKPNILMATCRDNTSSEKGSTEELLLIEPCSRKDHKNLNLGRGAIHASRTIPSIAPRGIGGLDEKRDSNCNHVHTTGVMLDGSGITTTRKRHKQDSTGKKKKMAKKKASGCRFSGQQSTAWTERLKETQTFVMTHGHCRIPNHYPENPALAKWAKRQRHQYQVLKRQTYKGTTVKETESGGSGDYCEHKQDQQHEILDGEYIHNCEKASLSDQVPISTESHRGTHEKQAKPILCALTPERILLLENLCFVWELQSASWTERYNELKQFCITHGHSNVPLGYKLNKKLATWVKSQRRQYSLRKRKQPSAINDERIRLLNQINFEWVGKRGGDQKRCN